jgi:hypothetical protein
VDGKGWGVLLSPVRDHILQEFNTVYVTRFKTYKNARPPQTKPRRGEGIEQIKTCRMFLYRPVF